jgi:hypothetical protein
VAYDNNRMAVGRRTVVLSFITSLALGGKPQDAQQQQPPRPGLPPPQSPDNQDHRLPNGKSQLNAIAIHNHEQALKEANELVELAGQLRNDLQQAGTYVVPLSSLKKTEEIEKLARRIRSRLKA